ncbi:MAG: hypothetical protein ABI685_09610 [Ferruginibacter sp.]
MRTVYVNEKWYKDHEVVRGLIVVPKTIAKNIPIIFDDLHQRLIIAGLQDKKTEEQGGFHFFARFCQFVVYFNYDTREVLLGNTRHKIGMSIEVMYFGTSDNINDAFDYMLKLRNAGWEQRTRDEILRIAKEIKNDYYETHFEIAEMITIDPVNSPSSYI